MFRTGKRLCSHRMIFVESSSPAAVWSARCAHGKDERNWAAMLSAQEAEQGQEQRGEETPQQMEQEGTFERRHQHQGAKLMSAASPAWICGALAVCDGV